MSKFLGAFAARIVKWRQPMKLLSLKSAFLADPLEVGSALHLVLSVRPSDRLSECPQLTKLFDIFTSA